MGPGIGSGRANWVQTGEEFVTAVSEALAGVSKRQEVDSIAPAGPSSSARISRETPRPTASHDRHSRGHARWIYRCFDVVFSAGGMLVLSPLCLTVYALIYLDNRSPLFRQQRVGQNQQPFTLVKFRSMRTDTAETPTHLADANSVTRLGGLLRRTKLDELPQLWNVFKGDMSLVGPRPCLQSQTDLIAARAARGVFQVKPGITGLAQIQDVDMSTPQELAELDAKMIETMSVYQYFRYIVLTVLGKGKGDRVKAA